jgi:hypothetical protein
MCVSCGLGGNIFGYTLWYIMLVTCGELNKNIGFKLGRSDLSSNGKFYILSNLGNA